MMPGLKDLNIKKTDGAKLLLYSALALAVVVVGGTLGIRGLRAGLSSTRFS